MSHAALLGWTVVALLLVITPGLDTLLVLRHTMIGGQRAGLTTLVGVCAGLLVWATASLIGLTALLTASQLAYDIVRIAGAAYLVWLGGTAIWKTLPRNRQPAGPRLEDTRRAVGTWSALRTGMLTNLLNPKAGVFYISLLPQFMPTGPGAVAWGALLVAIHLAVTIIWFLPLVWLAAKARGLLRRDRVRRWLDRVTATVLIGLGVKLAAESR